MRYWDATTPARNLPQPGLPAWNTTPHYGVPWSLRGLQVDRPGRRYHEPWTAEAAAMRQSASGALGFTHLHQPQRRVRDDPKALYVSRSGETADATRAGIATNRKPWDATPFVSVPAPLRGLKPMTPEVWAVDNEQLMWLEHRRMDEAGEEQRDAPGTVMKVDIRELTA